MEYIFIYLLQLSKIITILAWTLLALSGICAFSWAACMREFSDYVSESLIKESLEFGKYSKKFTIVFFVLSLFFFVAPTRETLLFMGGVYYGKKAIKTVVTDSKIEKINTIIEYELDKKIEELRNKKPF